MSGNAPKKSRVEGRNVTRSERSIRRVRREEDDETTPSPVPHHQARLPTPDTSASMSNRRVRNLMHEYGSSSLMLLRLKIWMMTMIWKTRRTTAALRLRTSSPPIRHMLLMLFGTERGVLTGHQLNNAIRSWDVVIKEAADFIASSGLGGLLEAMYEGLDMPLICVFIERWYPETNTFHMSFGEMTITLHDTEFLLGIPASGLPVVPKCEDEVEVKERSGWHGGGAKQSMMREVAEEPKNPPSRLARIYLWWLVTSTLFVDKSKTHGHASFIELLKKYGEASQYAWGATTLVNLYRELGVASRSYYKQVVGCLTLLQSWIYAYFPSLRPHSRRSWTPDQVCSRRWIPTAVKNDGNSAALIERRCHLDSLFKVPKTKPVCL